MEGPAATTAKSSLHLRFTFAGRRRIGFRLLFPPRLLPSPLSSAASPAEQQQDRHGPCGRESARRIAHLQPLLGGQHRADKVPGRLDGRGAREIFFSRQTPRPSLSFRSPLPLLQKKKKKQSSTDDASFRAVWTPRAPAPTSACDPSRSRSPWPGVECADGRVVALSLAGRGLEGTASPELARLSKLARLDLANNTLLGALPPEWGALSELRELALSRNRFSGELPAAWGGMRSLRGVDLSLNSLRGSLPPVWGASWANATTLDLSGNGQLSGELPAGWRGLSAMRALNLSGNRLAGTLPGDWAGAQAFPQLRSLDLSSNALEGSIPSSWVSSLSFPLVDTLGLDRNCFGGALPRVSGDVGSDPRVFLSPQRADCAPGSRAGLCGDVPVGLRAYDAVTGEALLQVGPSCAAIGGGAVDAPLRGRLRAGAGAAVVVCVVLLTGVATFLIVSRRTKRREHREALIAEIKARRGSGASGTGSGAGGGGWSRDNRARRGSGGALSDSGSERSQQRQKAPSLPPLQQRMSAGNGKPPLSAMRVPATVDEESGLGSGRTAAAAARKPGGGRGDGEGGKGDGEGGFRKPDSETYSGLAPISPWAAEEEERGGGGGGGGASTGASATGGGAFEADPSTSSMLGVASPWGQQQQPSFSPSPPPPPIATAAVASVPPSSSVSDSAPTPEPPSSSSSASAADASVSALLPAPSFLLPRSLSRGRPSNTASAPDAGRGSQSRNLGGPTVSGASSGGGSGSGGGTAQGALLPAQQGGAEAGQAPSPATAAAAAAGREEEEIDGRSHRTTTARAKKVLARLKTWS